MCCEGQTHQTHLVLPGGLIQWDSQGSGYIFPAPQADFESYHDSTSKALTLDLEK